MELWRAPPHTSLYGDGSAQTNPLSTHATSIKTPLERWGAVRAMFLSHKTQETLSGGHLGEGASRFVAVSQLLSRIARDPDQRGFKRSLMSFSDALRQEVSSVGDGIYKLFSKTFAPYWTIIVIVVESTMFAFMAGEHSRLCWYDYANDGEVLLPRAARPIGPDNLLLYLEPGTETTLLETTYLHNWGAFHLPTSTRSGGYRWLTTAFLHISLAHCTGNLIVYAALSAPFELRVGTRDSIAVWFLTAIGGTLAQAGYGNPCTVLVGASGTVFGSFGFFFADTIAFWHRTKRPYTRAFLVVFVAMVFGSQLRDPALSHLAHAGGFWVGFAVGLALRRQQEGARVSDPLFWAIAFLLALWVVVSIAMSVLKYDEGLDVCIRYGEDGAWFEPVHQPVCPVTLSA